ncbi:MAG: ABC transporter permease [Treponema sp.]|nr:ABC transporter permease [Treponema sp.]
MAYLLRKLAVLLLTLFLVSVAVFCAFHVIPGDSAMLILGTEASEESLAALRHEMGTDRSLFVQYVSWLGGCFRGDFGVSLKYSKGVAELLKPRVMLTSLLGLLSLAMVFAVGLPLGLFAGWTKSPVVRAIAGGFSVLGISLPGFFLSLLLIWVFGLWLRLFTPGAAVSLGEDAGAFFRFMVFPALAVALPQIAVLSKYLAAAVREEASAPYVKAARSRGCGPFRVLTCHIFKNAVVAVVPLLGMIVGSIFSGSIIVEQVFGISGVGRLLISAVSYRDFPLAQTIVLYIAALVVVVNFIVDLVVQWLDPRIRLDAGRLM